MTASLSDQIKKEIQRDGAMPISTYMERCLYDPHQGYYTTRIVFGTEGDFVTAPEISQIFGELIGAWAMDTWVKLGKPSPFNLIEMGPGRGTLMSDMIRSFKTNSNFSSAAQIKLVEISANLKDAQQRKLKNCGFNIEWHEDISTLLDQPFIIITNELLDALPFEQYVKTQDGWMMRCVNAIENDFCFTTNSQHIDESNLPSDADNQPLGTIFEKSAPRENLIKTIASKIAIQTSAALMIDYGHDKSGFGDTFQALKDNKYCEVLSHQGQEDLTNHVDFEALSTIAATQKINPHEIITQGEFLLRLGLLERAGQLGHGKHQAQQRAIRQAVERLAGNDPNKHQMGDLFKALILSPKEISLAPF
jgi:SAM-dependent MidA family methyltransferase